MKDRTARRINYAGQLKQNVIPGNIVGLSTVSMSRLVIQFLVLSHFPLLLRDQSPLIKVKHVKCVINFAQVR